MRRNHLLSKTLALNLFPEDAICSLHPSRLGDLDCYRSRTIALSWFHRSVLHYQLEILGVCGDVPTVCAEGTARMSYVLHRTLSLKSYFRESFPILFPQQLYQEMACSSILGTEEMR